MPLSRTSITMQLFLSMTPEFHVTQSRGSSFGKSIASRISCADFAASNRIGICFRDLRFP